MASKAGQDRTYGSIPENTKMYYGRDDIQQLLCRIKELDPISRLAELREIVLLQEKVIDDLVKENLLLKEENASMRIHSNENRIKMLLKENADLKRENDDLKRIQLNPQVLLSERDEKDNKPICTDLHSKATANNKVYYMAKPFRNAIEAIDSVILNTLEANLLSINIDLCAEPYQEGRSDMPLVVFCPMVSRLGADVDVALTGVDDNVPVVIVILHFVPKKLVKSNLSSMQEQLPETTISRARCIVNMAYYQGQGLYSCGPNNAAMQKLMDYFTDLSLTDSR